MAVLTDQTKAEKMRAAFGQLSHEQLAEGDIKGATRTLAAAGQLNDQPASLVRLHDILTGASA